MGSHKCDEWALKGCESWGGVEGGGNRHTMSSHGSRGSDAVFTRFVALSDSTPSLALDVHTHVALACVSPEHASCLVGDIRIPQLQAQCMWKLPGQVSVLVMCGCVDVWMCGCVCVCVCDQDEES